MIRWTRRRLARITICLSLALSAASLGHTEDRFPPSPYDILRTRDLDTPLLDAVPFCAPKGLDVTLDPILEQAAAGEWSEARDMLSEWASQFDTPAIDLVVLDAVLQSRSTTDREDWLEAEDWLRTVLRRRGIEEAALCARMELARLLLLMRREAEAGAQLTRAQQWLEERDDESVHHDEIKFYRTEILYRIGHSFDAHLAYRRLTKSKNPRLALAARLRLTDLSFDAGKSAQASDEYETLLPRASAFGASTAGWALRASEAALDAGDPSRALRWLEQFLDSGVARDARDAAEIRLADIDVAYEDPLAARKRLAGISGRRRSDPTGALAAVRAIDLGVSPGSPDQRLDLLMVALRDQRSGVRRYTLGVMMKELAHRNDLDGALAVATRLAYEGIDPVISPDYTEVLDGLLARIASGDAGATGCRAVVRALGGRYGILIERASMADAFARVGACFEEMELPWLAATLYRSITRRFGTAGAQQVALPLARTSLAIGEVTLARRVAEAALEEPDEDEVAWRAIRAEADFIDERYVEASRGLRQILDAEEMTSERGKLIRLLALTVAGGANRADVDFVAERVPRWLSEGTERPRARAALIESAMLAAHAYRLAGRRTAALELYRTVDREAGAGALRSSARFWLGLEDAKDSRGGPAWGEDPNIALGSPWGRYALFEEHLAPLWRQYGSGVR